MLNLTKQLMVLVTLLLISSTAMAEATVSTLAGSTAGFLDAQGTAAKFNNPAGVSLDQYGNVYIADSVNNRIRKVDTTGQVTTFAGSGAAGSANALGTAATFNSPTGIDVDAYGNVFVADSGNNQIRMIDTVGNVTTFAGSVFGNADGLGTAARFSVPTDVAIDQYGNIFVTDSVNNLIRKIDASANVTTFAGSSVAAFTNGLGIAAEFNNPKGISIDQNGNIYVADSANNVIRMITSGGVVSTLAGSSVATAGLVDGSGVNAQFNNPEGVTIDQYGDVYVADATNNVIRKINTSGIVTTLSGAAASGFVNGVAAVVRFSNPSDATIDLYGNLYIADFANHAIRKVTPDTTPPTGSISIAEGAFTNATTINLVLSCTDNFSCKGMRFSTDGITFDPYVAYTTAATRTLIAGDGLKDVYVQFIDPSDNYSISYTAKITLDTVPPAVPTISSPANNSLSNNTNPAVAGGGDAGSNITVKEGIISIGLVTTDIYSKWTMNANTVAERAYDFSAIASDQAGNVSAASAVIRYTVDTTAPIITAPTDVYVEATSTAGTPVNDATIIAFLNNASTWDLLDGYAVASNNAPAILPMGTNSISFNTTDTAGNAAIAVTANLFIRDSTAPTVTAPVDLYVEATASQTTAAIGTATASDLFATTISSNAPATYPVGTTAVTWTATDLYSNSSTAMQSIIVSDTTKPVITPPADVYVEATGSLNTVAIGTATATDIFAVTVTNDAPTFYPVGTTLVTWTATDLYSNIATATQSITVADTTKPIFTVFPLDVYVEASAVQSTVAIGTATATDIFAVTVTNNAPATFPVATTVVTWTATDLYGNTASTTQNIVVSDTIKPIITAPADIYAEATGSQNTIATGLATATDIFAVTISSNAPATFPVGTTTVTWSATDLNNNTSLASQNIIIADTTKPIITLPADIYVEASGPLSTVAIGKATATDIFPVTISSNAPATYPVGTTLVTWLATDIYANSSSGIENIVVRDTTAPVLNAGSEPFNINVPGNPASTGVVNTYASIATFLNSAKATDLVDGIISVSNNAPALFINGSRTTVVFTATDAAGNQATPFSRTVTINPTGSLAPSGTGFTIAQSLALGLDPNATTNDTDGDGIPDAVEVGDPANPYDLDNDGILDLFESGGLGQDKFTASGLRTDQGTVSINSPGQLTLVKHTSITNAPPGIIFPYGLLDYYSASTVGGSQIIRITHSTALPANLTLYKVNANGVFTLLPTSIWIQVDAFSVDLTLTDGDLVTDLDGVANGIIVDPLAIGGIIIPPTRVGKLSHGNSNGGGCSLRVSDEKGIDPALPVMIVLSMLWLFRRRTTLLLRGNITGIALLALCLMNPTNSSAEDHADAPGPWRAGVAVGAFKVSGNYPGDISTYKKVIPGYVVNLGYEARPGIETGLLISGGGKGSSTQAGNTVQLNLPPLPQVYIRGRKKIGEDWGTYGMVTAGSLLREAHDANGVPLYSDRVASIGLGAGISWDYSKDVSMDLGVFTAGIPLTSKSNGFKSSAPGVVLAVNQSFGSKITIKESADEPVIPQEPRRSMQAPAVEQKVKMPALKLKPVNIDKVIFFSSGSIELNQASCAILNKIAKTLMNRNQFIELAGHTDNGESPAINLAMSTKRLQKVRAYLLARGVSNNRIKTKAYGEAMPVADNENAAGRATNRRVELRAKG